MVVEEARNKASSLVDESFDWVHGDSAEGCEVDALMVQVVSIFKKVVTDVRNHCRVPRMHPPMNKVEVTIPSKLASRRTKHKTPRVLSWIQIHP